MNRITGSILAALAIAGTATACSSASSHPSVAACTKVLQADYGKAQASPDFKVTSRPAECDGLSTPQLKDIMGKILSREWFGSPSSNSDGQ